MGKKGYIATAAIVVVFGFLLWSYVKRDEGNLTGDPLADRAKLLANRLDAAMNIIGTDFDEIKAVFSQITDNLDFARLNNAFGVRPYKNWVHGFPDFMYPQLNMISMLHEEISFNERGQINQILVDNNVTSQI